MPVFKIHRQRESAKSSFRFAPHTSGAAVVKQRDYELAGEKEAASAYALFNELRGTEDALEVGDVVELPEGALKIYKYVGLEDATWWVAPVKADSLDAAGLVEAGSAV
jgi:hypothetical protein